MARLFQFLLTGIGLLATLFFGADCVFVGLLASDQQLAQYPWGTELGWAYLSPKHYVLSSSAAMLALWLPYLMWMAIRIEEKKEGRRYADHE